ncbi:MAG: arginine decarboxylase, pyruvoyl-dependent [Melioribacteraceae bacterium]|nr:arginine decarboxylase, pyruvoyl-dependent [Melioribacteraceae bacterium]MCF8355184.1 arginine decarboxylase, pyruvoyl-dependent [Melioribacteraceae bacterium]MCF8395397.1 arginine decarboxylase, pyruvoyl-dependent [Melioribacteraceae bacterium]MCF8419897.1 arginine decarboxylase, pyruvoyl-dependent [Melioribacteraceae bacterium]
MYVPKRIFFTKGVGRHKEYLASFELALRHAQIEKFNLVSVSSIYPVGCKRINIEQGLSELAPGQIVHAVMARNATNEPNRQIASSIGVAIPADTKMYGYLSEHHPFGQTADLAGDYAEDLAASMLATTLGIDFNSDEAWNEKEQVFKMSGQIVRTFNVTQSARGDKNGLWTTTVAAAILLA